MSIIQFKAIRTFLKEMALILYLQLLVYRRRSDGSFDGNYLRSLVVEIRSHMTLLVLVVVYSKCHIILQHTEK